MSDYYGMTDQDGNLTQGDDNRPGVRSGEDDWFKGGNFPTREPKRNGRL